MLELMAALTANALLCKVGFNSKQHTEASDLQNREPARLPASKSNYFPKVLNKPQSSKSVSSFPEPVDSSRLNDYEAWNQEGNRLLKAKRYEEAIAIYERALEIKPNASYAWQQRGEALKQLQRYAEAIASYKKAIELSENPISRYQAFNCTGSLLFDLKMYEEAIAAYNQSLAIFPNGMASPHLLEMKGMAMSKLKQYEEAAALFDQAYEKAVEICAKA